MASEPVKPEGKAWINPYLVVCDVEKAMDFYADAFGLCKGMAWGEPDGRPFYGEVYYEDMLIMVGLPQAGKSHPVTRSTAMTLYCFTDDIAGLAERAKEAGARVIQDLEDQFWGHRTCLLVDPDGHAWMWAQVMREVTLPEMKRGGGET